MDDRVMNTQELIPLSHLSLDLSEPISGWPAIFAERGVEIVLDDLGRPSVPRQVLGELLAESQEREARVLEDQRRRDAERADSKVPAGVPAIDGSPYEAMVAAGGVVLPSEEFGRPRPDFLAEELAAGERESAEQRRAVARMKDDLGGKQ
jgi:hypothetical protein